MSTRVSPLERIRADIDDLFASDRHLGEVLEEVARVGVRLLFQTALEAELTEFLGRERYAHGERARPGSRNGHCPTTIKTTAGPITIERPKLRGTDQAFASRLLGVGVCRTNALESLVIAGFVRGLSVRDVEATLADALGPEATLSKSTVSRVCEAIKTEFDVWKKRDLADVALEYLYLDGSHFRYHDGARAEPVLAAWGMTTEGRPVLVGLEPGASESTDAWRSFLNGMVARGLRPPLLVISDGAPGLIAAVELVFPHSLRQRCVIHRARNIRQGPRRAPGRGEEGVLGPVRRHRHRARRGGHRRGPGPGRALHRHLRQALPHRRGLPRFPTAVDCRASPPPWTASWPTSPA